MRPRAFMAFYELFLSCAREAYPRFDFAVMNNDEYGATLMLD
jgi:hypothetical protein